MKMSMGKIAAVLAIIGALLLIVSAFIGWYTISVTASAAGFSASGSENFLPGSSYTSSFSGSTTTQSYSSTNATNVGNLFMATQYILIGGFILGLLGGLLLFASSMKGRESWSKPAMILLVLALLMAIVAPAYVAAAAPGAFKADIPASASSNNSGPWSSFTGSCSAGATCFTGGGGGTGVSGTTTWGPAAGWYLAWGGFVVLLIAIILLWRDRMTAAKMGQSEATSSPAPASDTYSMNTNPPGQTPPGGTQ